jgi:hypothetical protein
MIKDGEAPIVPDARRKNAVVEGPEFDSAERKEEQDALATEAPFVPIVSKRSSGVVNV